MSASTVIPNGELVKELRKQHGWNQDDLLLACEKVVRLYETEKLGCKRTALQKIEAGLPVSVVSLRTVARALEEPIQRLLHIPEATANQSGVTNPHPADVVLRLILDARYELSASGARQLLWEAVLAARAWEQIERGAEPILWHCQALADLAHEEEVPRTRAGHWRAIFEMLEDKFTGGEADIAQEYGVHAVRCFQDQYAFIARRERSIILNRAKAMLEEALGGAADPEEQARLLARKSAVLRMQAQTVRWEVKNAHLAESVSSAERAARQSSEAPPILLELALAYWAHARVQQNDKTYVDILRRAERCLLDPRLADWEAASLARARFYRLTYRALDACEEYERLSRMPMYKRRVLRDSYLYGEAAAVLWRNGYPSQVYQQHCRAAETLMEEGIAAGCTTARLITALAPVKAIIGRLEVAQAVLLKIHRDHRPADWNALVRTIQERRNAATLIDDGFVLGIDDADTWTRLGTFFRMFFEDDRLAQRFYEAACHLDERNVVAHTNLARLLLRAEDKSLWPKVQLCLEVARRFADRRFHWWRSVSSMFDDQKGREELPVLPHVIKPGRGITFLHLEELTARFEAIRESTNTAKTADDIVQVLCEVGKLTFGVEKSEYKPSESGTPAVSMFTHRGIQFMTGCKWTRHPASQKDLAAFTARLDLGRWGLYISRSGFAPAALESDRVSGAPKICLMDGNEMDDLMHHHMSFDELLLRKRLFLQLEDDWLHPIRPLKAVELPEL